VQDDHRLPDHISMRFKDRNLMLLVPPPIKAQAASRPQGA
jgi:hypothetical protein